MPPSTAEQALLRAEGMSSAAQISAAHFRTVAENGRPVGQENPTRLQNVSMAADLQGQVSVLLDQQDGQRTFAVEFDQPGEDLLHQ